MADEEQTEIRTRRRAELGGEDVLRRDDEDQKTRSEATISRKGGRCEKSKDDTSTVDIEQRVSPWDECLRQQQQKQSRARLRTRKSPQEKMLATVIQQTESAERAATDTSARNFNAARDGTHAGRKRVGRKVKYGELTTGVERKMAETPTQQLIKRSECVAGATKLEWQRGAREPEMGEARKANYMTMKKSTALRRSDVRRDPKA